MSKCSPLFVWLCGTMSLAASGLTAVAQNDRQAYLDRTPLAAAEVQQIIPPSQPEYDAPNAAMMYRPLEEDPLSYYVRTQDGEWLIPTSVDAEDSWVRILILGPNRPTVADVSVDINGKPFRAAREQWIDKLLSEAKATSLVRAGEAAADAAGISEESAGGGVEADEAKDDQSDSEPTEELALSRSAEDEDNVPMVRAQSRKTSSLFKRLINYLAADQTAAEREEVRWLLAEWTGGPALMTLSPAFAWRRADVAPLWYALDLDGDQKLSADELSKTTETLKQADINRDEILNLSELDRLAKKHASQQRTKGYPLIVVIDAHTDWKALSRHLQTAYPSQGQAEVDATLLDRIAHGDQSLNVGDLANLMSLTPDMVYRVAFANTDAKVELLAVGGKEDPKNWDFHSETDQAITVARREVYMELTAAQGEIDEQNESGDMQQTQVSIGAVVDGYPLLRLLDHDNNRQLTLRERRNIDELLRSLDLSSDGQIDVSEVPTAIRLVVTHGPQSHVHLANAIAAQRDHGEIEQVEAPDWFVGMDRNRDGDLSRREFQGSPRQFAKYDKDRDGLISLLEIQQAATKN